MSPTLVAWRVANLVNLPSMLLPECFWLEWSRKEIQEILMGGLEKGNEAFVAQMVAFFAGSLQLLQLLASVFSSTT